MDSQEIKLQSKKLKELSKKYGYEIKHSHTLEIMSQLNNNSNWHISSLDNPNFIRTGINDLDQDLMGGLEKGKLISILGATNSGKTSFCISLVCNALRKKKKVLIYDLDDFLFRNKNLILSNLSNISLSKIISNDLNENEIKKLEKIELNILNKYLILKNVSNDYSIEELSEFIFNERINFKFDLLLIDSAQLITSPNKETTNKIFTKLNNIAKAYECVVLTPLQANRQARNKIEKDSSYIIKSSEIASTINIANLSSMILSINFNKDKDEILIYLDKNRNGVNKNLYKQKTCFDKANLIYN